MEEQFLYTLGCPGLHSIHPVHLCQCLSSTLSQHAVPIMKHLQLGSNDWWLEQATTAFCSLDGPLQHCLVCYLRLHSKVWRKTMVVWKNTHEFQYHRSRVGCMASDQICIGFRTTYKSGSDLIGKYLISVSTLLWKNQICTIWEWKQRGFGPHLLVM